MEIKNNIDHYHSVAEAAGARLIAVSKTHPAEKITEAYSAGQRLFGENKVQELTTKSEALPADIEWHFIGHLQTNKVKFLAPFVSLVHAVDSLKLMEEIHKQGKKINRVIPCLLQIYIAEEDTKFGFDESELRTVLENPSLQNLEFLEIRGLMGMASLTEDQNKIRQEFRGLKKLYEEIKWKKPSGNIHMQELSMGMTSDYAIALEEGSTLIRIGTAIFGERPPRVNDSAE